MQISFSIVDHKFALATPLKSVCIVIRKHPSLLLCSYLDIANKVLCFLWLSSSRGLTILLNYCYSIICFILRFFPPFPCYNVQALSGIALSVSSHLDDRPDNSGRTTFLSVLVPMKRKKNGTTQWDTGHYRRVSFHQKISVKNM